MLFFNSYWVGFKLFLNSFIVGSKKVSIATMVGSELSYSYWVGSDLIGVDWASGLWA